MPSLWRIPCSKNSTLSFMAVFLRRFPARYCVRSSLQPDTGHMPPVIWTPGRRLQGDTPREEQKSGLLSSQEVDMSSPATRFLLLWPRALTLTLCRKGSLHGMIL